MPTYSAQNIPDEVGRGELDGELAELLKTAPRLGAHEPISEQRAAHDAFIPKRPLPIGRVEPLLLVGPHGTIPVRCYYPSRPGPAEGGPRLKLQVPLYPETKLPFETKAGVENRTALYLETAGILLFAYNLIPQGVDFSQPYITPMNAESLEGLPPTLLVTSGYDPLRDVGHQYAKRLAEAGNALTYVHHPDLTHGFIQFTEHSRRCLEVTEEIGHHLAQALAA